ncbi:MULTISPECIES: hypothetical protein [unclassified Flavobacterium]|uniref:hypothetical protein n=1 Tax=unclassified Flavobacterium TaxID=196869 RepID=UPI0025BC0AD3|nr:MULTISPECIES: hypothetical protein [unclassified Flavobacterium]
MIDKEVAIKAINSKLEQLKSVGGHQEFNNWRKITSTTLSNIYTNKEDLIQKFESIKAWVTVMSGSGDRTNQAKREAEDYLKSIISDIEHFGLPQLIDSKQSEKLSVNVHQQNNQNQSTSVNINIDFILDVLKGELRNSEIEEVKDILESDDEPKEKKKKFIDKIKSFGSDVASNILANILTNPQVYEQIGKML